MSFYGMTPEAVMGIPIRLFWFMSRQIERIQAQRDLRALTVGVCSQGGSEAAQECRERLVLEIGEVYVIDDNQQETESPLNAVRDEAGFAELKALAALL